MLFYLLKIFYNYIHLKSNFCLYQFLIFEIRNYYYFNETCQKTVPEAIICFLEGNSYEDVVRNAISIGGDSDTLACIAGSIAEAYYDMPKEYKEIALGKLDNYLRDIYKECHSVVSDKQVVVKDDWGDYFVDVRNGLITNMENSVDDIVHSAVHAPTLTDILVVPEAIAAVGVICSLPALYYYGVPALGKLAISVDIAGQHIKENLHSSKTV